MDCMCLQGLRHFIQSLNHFHMPIGHLILSLVGDISCTELVVYGSSNPPSPYTVIQCMPLTHSRYIWSTQFYNNGTVCPISAHPFMNFSNCIWAEKAPPKALVMYAHCQIYQSHTYRQNYLYLLLPHPHTQACITSDPYRLGAIRFRTA